MLKRKRGGPDESEDSGDSDAAPAEASGAKDPAKGHGDDPRLTPKKAKNYVGVAKVLIPAVVPAVAPYAVRAAGLARDGYDRYRAHRLGIEIDQLEEYAGRGGALNVRIAGLSDGLAELRKSQQASADDTRFADDSAGTLRQLAATVRAAERMPAPRRRSAHKAAEDEIGRMEDELLRRLGIPR
jgi:hypothetical protein